MNLLEWQAKQRFQQYDLVIPRGQVVTDAERAAAVARELGDVMVKAQVPVGGRGKAGGIRRAASVQAARQAAQALLGSTIRGHTVRQVLVEKALDVAQELYLAVALDREARQVVVMASSQGGIDIEATSRQQPDAVRRVALDPWIGVRDYHVRALFAATTLCPTWYRPFAEVIEALVACVWDLDATLVEINPLVLDESGQLVAADAKIVVDDNALYRHPDLAAWVEPADQATQEARDSGTSYVRLDGNIGCIVNGAGLAMATMDLVHQLGGAPANFMDVGGGASGPKVERALRLLLADPQVEAILINIFGGITRCDEVAQGILSALTSIELVVPLVVRLAGTRSEEGQRLLADAGIATVPSFVAAVQRALAQVGDIT